VKRRITTAIVGVTAFILLAVGIPLAIVAQRSIVRSEVVRLQATVAQTLTEIQQPIDDAQLSQLRDEPDAPPPFGVYDAAGRLTFGSGPTAGDLTVAEALRGATSTSTDGAVVVATPITDPNEKIVGVLRVETARNELSARIRSAWLLMAAVGGVAVGCSWLIADRLGRRLAGPLVELADGSRQMAVGGVLSPTPPTGIDEIDQLHDALVDNSVRINDALVRERQFSADVSHQLRTPIAALRLKLDAAGSGPIDESARSDLARLEATVEHLLAFARDTAPAASTCRLDSVVADAVARWAPTIEAEGRAIAGEWTGGGGVDASAGALAQILDVLIDNALRHGTGTVSVAVRPVSGGVALDVADCGALGEDIAETVLFARHQGTNHGIGLALARSIAQAEGGRLVLAHRHPTTFSIVMLRTDSIDPD
jgi:signal transduction histidine kinase